jgi:hypothetical protein
MISQSGTVGGTIHVLATRDQTARCTFPPSSPRPRPSTEDTEEDVFIRVRCGFLPLL